MCLDSLDPPRNPLLSIVKTPVLSKRMWKAQQGESPAQGHHLMAETGYLALNITLFSLHPSCILLGPERGPPRGALANSGEPETLQWSGGLVNPHVLMN